MTGASERRSAAFLAWEARGRGFQVWEHPVTPEPLFATFVGHGMPDSGPVDDGRKPTILSSFMRRLSESLAPPAKAPPPTEDEDERVPEELVRGELVELQAHLPPGLSLDLSACAEFFTSVRGCREPVAFEIVADGTRIRVQFVVSEDDQSLVSRQLEAYFPEVSFLPGSGSLEEAWLDGEDAESAAVEFGLGKEFVVPFAGGRGDPFVGLCGALGGVEAGEIGLFQAIFAPAERPWNESIMRSVTHGDGSALFVNAPELMSGAQKKIEAPLYGAVVRLAAKSPENDRVWEIICDAATALGAYGSTRGNELIPLSNDEYPHTEHVEDVLRRQTRRSGMLLNAAELAGFVHLPSSEVRAPKLRQKVRKTKAVPAIASGRGLVVGVNEHNGVKRTAALSRDQRARHVHVIGASGTGKSTLLLNLIRQDLEAGEGISVIDPHGDLIDRVLEIIPPHRIDDVVLLDPSDEEHIVGFNILSAHSDWEKNLLASDLVGVFRRLSSAWGDQMNSVLHNAILAFLKRDQPGTLLDLRRFLLEPAFRNEVLKTVRDPNVSYYWRTAFPQLTGNKSVGSIVTRLDTFLAPESIRFMVGQRENRIDFGSIMDGGKIFLAKLSRGAIGPDNSHLLGSLIVAKLQSEAMARQRQAEAARRYHWAYLDEFHDFLTPSLAESLAGVRKYRLGLTLGHQEMRQVERDSDVAAALLNTYTRIVFRVGDKDARTLAAGFSSFEAQDIQNLGTGEAICRVEKNDCDFNLSVPLPKAPDPIAAASTRNQATAASQKKYSRPRAEIEAMFAAAVAEEPKTAARREQPSVQAKAPVPAPEPPPTPSLAPQILATVGETRPVEKIQEESERPASVPAAAPPRQIRASKEVGEKHVATPLEAGKGGAQHTTIQARIRKSAVALGFHVELEKSVLEGAGQVDVALSRGSVAIACEVTITTTIDHEVGNIAKCAKAGYPVIAVVGVSEKKLSDIEAAVARSLGADIGGRVRYFLPEAFIEHLNAIPQPEPSTPEVKVVKGYKVRTTVPQLTPEEAKAKEREAIRAIAETLRQKAKER